MYGTSQLLLGFHFIVGKQVFAVGSVVPVCGQFGQVAEERSCLPMGVAAAVRLYSLGDVLQCFSELFL